MTGIVMIMGATWLWALDTLIRYPLLAAGFSTLEIVLLEHVILVAFSLPILIRSRRVFLSLSAGQWFGFLVIGALGSALGSLAFTHAFGVLNPTVVILLQKLQPLVAALLAFWLLKERLGPWFWAAMGVCLVGSGLMMAPGLKGLFAGNALAYTDAQWALMLGYGAALFAVFSWGAATVFGKWLSASGLNSQQLMAGRFSFGLVCLILVSLGASGNEVAHISDWQFVAKVLAMVLLSGLLGMYLYYQGLARAKGSIAALAEMSFAVAAITLNWLVLDATLSPLELAGAVVLVAGSLLAQWQDQSQGKQLAAA